MIDQHTRIRKAETIMALLVVWCLHVLIAASTPYGVDDWAWGTPYGIRVTMHGELDSRYVSNLLEVVITRSRFLKAILLGTIAALLPALSAKLVSELFSEKTAESEKQQVFLILFVLAEILFLTIPISVWRETYGWTCGFTYYGLAALLLICWQGLLLLALQTNKMAGIGELFLYGLFGFCVQLVLENVTVFVFAVNAMALLYDVIKRKKCSSRLLSLMVGCFFGTLLMFSSSIYESLLNTGSAMGGFRAFSFDRKAGILSILRQLCQRFIYFYPADIWGNNWVICCTICLLLLITGVRQKPFVRFFSALFCIGFIIYFLFVRFYGPLENHLPGWNEVRTQWVNLLFFWGVLLMVFLFQWNAKRAKRFLIFLWLSVPGVLLPLIAVKVITFRYYFCTNLFLIEFALALLASEYSAFDPRLLKVLSILVSISFIAVLIQRFTIYAQIWEGKKDRDARIQQARNGEITRLYFPELPHSEYLWIVEAPDGSEQVPFFREFYQIPDEVEMSNLPFED